MVLMGNTKEVQWQQVGGLVVKDGPRCHVIMVAPEMDSKYDIIF